MCACRGLAVTVLVVLAATSWPGVAAGPVSAAALEMSVSSAGEEAYPVGGSVRAGDGSPIEGATVAVSGTSLVAGTDTAGSFLLWLAPGDYTLVVRHPDFAETRRPVHVVSALAGLDFFLTPIPRFSEELTVEAVRADADTPVTMRDLDSTEIAQLDYGQEMPFLLERLPSFTQYSDTGSASGYSYLYLRGIPQTRMNLTLDGAPLNDPEDSAFYFSNFGDFASAIDSIQVQRGVGTSTVGAASFVGSVNFASAAFRDEAEVASRLGAGTFGTARTSVTLHSGRLAGSVKLFGHAAYQETDGFRRNSGVIQRSLYFGVSRDGERSYFKLFGFTGLENTQLAFLATDEATLERDLRNNPLAPEERDRFGQRFVQAQYHRTLGSATTMILQGYYNGSDGWYRIRDVRAEPSGLFEYGLGWNVVGATATLTQTRGRLGLTWGSHANDFGSRHTRGVVDGQEDYLNRGHKNEANTFVKLTWNEARWHHYADAQVRWARFRYEGDIDLGSVSWTFFNPKIGTRYDVGGGLSAYGSLGLAGREPGRLDMLWGEDNATLPYDLRAVTPEHVFNVEAGVDLTSRQVTAHANLYLMEFRDEIALTGELSEIGLPVRRNVDRSYRRGVEFDLTWRTLSSLRLQATANFSRNRIAEWVQFYDVYDTDGAWVGAQPVVHRDVPPLVSPGVVANLAATWTPVNWLSLGSAARYTGRAHLDNTGNDAFTTPSWFSMDASATIDLRRLMPFATTGTPQLRIRIDNLLDNDRLYASGYSYLYYQRDALGLDRLEGIRYYYPQATRSVFVALDLRF